MKPAFGQKVCADAANIFFKEERKNEYQKEFYGKLNLNLPLSIREPDCAQCGLCVFGLLFYASYSYIPINARNSPLFHVIDVLKVKYLAQTFSCFFRQLWDIGHVFYNLHKDTISGKGGEMSNEILS